LSSCRAYELSKDLKGYNLITLLVIYLEEDMTEKRTTPPNLKLNDLQITPYQYEESIDLDDSLSIRARIILSKEQYSALGKLSETVSVVRQGIDEDPREMEISEIAWSEHGDEINEEILLHDTEGKIVSPFLMIENSISLIIKQNIIIDELLNLLVSNNIIRTEQINEVNYHALKDVACDYAKSRVAIGWLTQD
jgi:hypothetical protein